MRIGGRLAGNKRLVEELLNSTSSTSESEKEEGEGKLNEHWFSCAILAEELIENWRKEAFQSRNGEIGAQGGKESCLEGETACHDPTAERTPQRKSKLKP